MTERLLSVDAVPKTIYRHLRLNGALIVPLEDSDADAIAAELDRLYAAAEANQAPGPDEMVEAVAQVTLNEFGDLFVLSISDYPQGYIDPRARAALAEVIARDAKVREIVERPFDPAVDLETSRYRTVADLYLEVGK